MFQAEGANKSNQVLQFVPGLTALHRTALSPLRSAKAAAEQRRYVRLRPDTLQGTLRK